MTNTREDDGGMIAWLDAEKARHQPVKDGRSDGLVCAECRVPYPCEFAD